MFEVGQKVMCVDGRFPVQTLDWFSELPRRDGVYTVSESSMGVNWLTRKPEPNVHLAEITHFATSNGGTAGFSARRFRLPNPDARNAAEAVEEHAREMASAPCG